MRTQLIWRLSALYVCALGLSASIFLYEAWVSRVDDLDRSLRAAAVQLAGGIEARAAGGLGIAAATTASLQTAEIHSLRYAVFDRHHTAPIDASSSSLLRDIARSFPNGPPDGSFDFAVTGGRQERGYLHEVDHSGARFGILVSGPTLSLADTLRWMRDETLVELVPVLLPLFLGTLLIAPLTIRRSLAPIDRLSAEVALVEPNRTDLRLVEDGVPLEILPLVHKINEALERIDQGFDLQRRFTANAAHELRTPLAILRARVDGLADSRDKAGLIKDIERMTRLVHQLLLAGRLEMQQLRPDRAVDLVDIARETVERLALLPAAKAHELRLDVPHRSVVIDGDAESLCDALRNLVDNAIAHGPAGSPVEIAVRSDGALEVRDRGPGIPCKYREQIFEPFWRARQEGGEGAGLGLAIVRNIVVRHGGRITVTDNPGGGALFRMEFPLAKAL